MQPILQLGTKIETMDQYSANSAARNQDRNLGLKPWTIAQPILQPGTRIEALD